MSNNIKQGSLDQITATSLLEDLKNPETKIKINAIHNLREISFALGRERTRKELLPFLISCIDEEEDEALVELAKILGNFIDCIGGINYIKELFNILEAILIVDDPNIRKETINSLKKTINQVEKIEFIENDIMEIIIRLGENENINQKISSLYIIIFIFPKLSEKNKEIVLNIILKFCKDETISLKKEVLNLIPEITQYLQINFIQKIISIFLEDKNDTTHIDIMNIIVSMKNLNNLSEIMDYLEKVLTKLACDNNWRVRLTVCDKLYEILNFPQITNKIKQTSIEIFVKLLEDSEAEVKNICCLRLEDMTKVLYKEDNFDRILKGIKKLEKDNTTYVRGALASNLLKICPFIGQKKTNDFIFPIFLNIIKDENHDIRMTLIKTLENLNKVLNVDSIIQGIIPSFIEISSNKSWRVRIQIMDVIPILSRILDKNNFMANIFPICISSLTDPVFAIREETINLLKKLYKDLKSDEFENKIIEKLNEMIKSTSYLVRNTVALFIKSLCEDENYKEFCDLIENKLINIEFILCNDKIVNVRMNCTLTLFKLKKICKNINILKSIDENLEKLKKDNDQDVIKIFENNMKNN